MITNDDIQKMIQVFATKQDLEKFVTKDEFNEKSDQVITRLDRVMGELKTIREEQAIHQVKHEDIDSDLAAIKAIPAVAHDLKKKSH